MQLYQVYRLLCAASTLPALKKEVIGTKIEGVCYTRCMRSETVGSLSLLWQGLAAGLFCWGSAGSCEAFAGGEGNQQNPLRLTVNRLLLLAHHLAESHLILELQDLLESLVTPVVHSIFSAFQLPACFKLTLGTINSAALVLRSSRNSFKLSNEHVCVCMHAFSGSTALTMIKSPTALVIVPHELH